jgi:transposase
MAYLTGERTQMVLFPASLEEYVPIEDPVRVYDAFVEQLDFAALGIDQDPEQVGPPEYDPKAMLKLLVYGYSYGIRSSRKLERATHHNLSFIWLMGGLKPDHKTIARFRRDHREALKKVFKQCVRMCIKLNLIEGNTLFVDGTKIRANASLGQSWTKQKWERVLEETDRRIETILAESDSVDLQEEEQPCLVNVQEELQDAGKLRERVREVLKELEGSSRKSINATDPDCRNMKSRQGVIAGYNLQSVVDDKHGLVVHTEVVTDNNDLNQFSSQIDQANEVLEKKCEVACADAGYASTEELKAIDQQGITVIVPSQEQAQRTPKGAFSQEKFVYDAEQDCYVCPEGQLLGYRKTDKAAGKKTYQIRNGSICRNCAHWAVCTKAKEGRAITTLIDQETKKRLEAQYEKAESQRVYKRRKSRVEPPFGYLKWNMGVLAFLLRGLSGVGAEASLLASCFNLRRMISLLGVRNVLQAWSTG